MKLFLDLDEISTASYSKGGLVNPSPTHARTMDVNVVISTDGLAGERKREAVQNQERRRAAVLVSELEMFRHWQMQSMRGILQWVRCITL
eukprot:scaffold28514_cov112-Skeletonema_dohrnii-CCMP3373.AAC.1